MGGVYNPLITDPTMMSLLLQQQNPPIAAPVGDPNLAGLPNPPTQSVADILQANPQLNQPVGTPPPTPPVAPPGQTPSPQTGQPVPPTGDSIAQSLQAPDIQQLQNLPQKPSPVPPSMQVAPPALPESPSEMENSMRIYQERLAARDAAAEQMIKYHPSLGKTILASVLGGLAGIRDPKLGYEVGSSMRTAGSPQQKALDIAEQRLQTAKESFGAQSEMAKQRGEAEKLRMEGQKLQLEGQKLSAEISGQRYKDMHEQASAEEAKALAHMHELETDPTFLRMKAGIATAAEIDKYNATHQETIPEMALKTFRNESIANKGREPTSEELVNLDKRMKAATNQTAFEAWLQAFPGEHNGRQAGTQDILDFEKKLKEKPPTVNTAAADAAVQRAYTAYQTHFNPRMKEYSDNMDRVQQTITSLNEKNPAADRLAVETALATVSRRMGQGGIEYLMGGRTKWESFKANVGQFSLNPWHEYLPAAQRKQLIQAFEKYAEWERQRTTIINQGGERAAIAETPAEIRKIESETETALSGMGASQAAPSKAAAANAPTVGTVVNGYRFKGGDPKDQNNWEQAK